jgi:hypothetical protein
MFSRTECSDWRDEIHDNVPCLRCMSGVVLLDILGTTCREYLLWSIRWPGLESRRSDCHGLLSLCCLTLWKQSGT